MHSLSHIFSTRPREDDIHIVVNVPITGERLKAPPTRSGEKRLHIADISIDILRRWSKKSKLSLPSISELRGLLNKPLPQDEKIPLTRIQFDNLVSGLTETTDVRYAADVERLFRISDAEASEILHLIFYNAAVQCPPPETGTEASFHSFWDDNIRKILELLVPSGTSIRVLKKNRPDYGFLKDNVCPFRGEEKNGESRDDPKAELSDKLTLIYSPAPYVFGYYAIGPDLTLAAICAPSTPSQIPVVQDLASANLRFKRDRIANLCRLINLSPYLYPLLKLIGYRDVPEFTVIKRDSKSVEIWTKHVIKLQEKGVPHVDALTHAAGSTIYVEPKGIAVQPSNVKELLDAIICVLRALQQQIISVGRATLRVFMDNHGAEVDIWSVGNLILESTSFTLDLSPELVELGTWIQNAAPDAKDALIAVEAYARQYVTNMIRS
ncbi:hypothetical protein F5887DRAFT_1161224 [Amanita rubescens]|nr:hypothetical protein F5887DRAFT_1161224 [Amanita rubescens]